MRQDGKTLDLDRVVGFTPPVDRAPMVLIPRHDSDVPGGVGPRLP